MKQLPNNWRPVRGGYEAGPEEGPLTAVCIPGIRGDPLEFVNLVPLIHGRVRVIRVPEDADASLRAIADRILADLPEQPLHIVGASFGGLLGAAMPPTRVRTLSTIGSLPERNTSARNAGILQLFLEPLPDPLYRLLYRLRTDRSLQNDGVLPMALPSKKTLRRRLRAIAAWELPSTRSFPTRCIWGQHDAMANWTEARVRELGMEPVIVPGGHFPHLSHPEAVREALLLPAG